MRRSLAPHTHDRWELQQRNKQFAAEAEARAVVRRIEASWDEQRAAMDDQLRQALHAQAGMLNASPLLSHPTPLPPPDTALRQRVDRAERNARAWHRLALVLGVCALLALAV
jgi:hypothetical protein